MDINTLSDKLQYVALYLAVALVAAFIVVGLLVWFFKREKFNDYKKYAIGIATGFAITMVVVFAYVKFQCNIDDMQAKLFYPILATLITAVAGAIAMLVSSLFNDKAVKISLIVTAALLLGCFIATMVLMAQYYGDIAEYYPNANLVGMIVSAVVFMVIMVVMWFVGDKRKMSDTRSIVYGAISNRICHLRFPMPNFSNFRRAVRLRLQAFFRSWCTAACSVREGDLWCARFTACFKRFKIRSLSTRCNSCSTILSRSVLSE